VEIVCPLMTQDIWNAAHDVDVCDYDTSDATCNVLVVLTICMWSKNAICHPAELGATPPLEE
jgi:hypothetical protein